MPNSFARRYEDMRVEAKSDQRFNRKLAVMQLGRGIASAADGYAKTAAGMYGTLGQQAAAGASGALQSLGNLLNRNQTTYPERPISSNNIDYGSNTTAARNVGGVANQSSVAPGYENFRMGEHTDTYYKGSDIGLDLTKTGQSASMDTAVINGDTTFASLFGF
jgi:hypothetical protein